MYNCSVFPKYVTSSKILSVCVLFHRKINIILEPLHLSPFNKQKKSKKTKYIVLLFLNANLHNIYARPLALYFTEDTV